MHDPDRVTDEGFGGALAFDRCLEQQFGLCRQLEALADALPSKVDTRAATLLSDRLYSTLRQCHRMEETVIFPTLLVTSPGISVILDRLRREHLEDQDHACDVRDVMAAFAMDRKRKDAEELGYMLRCLFVSLRRHVAFDRDHLLPLYRHTSAR